MMQEERKYQCKKVGNNFYSFVLKHNTEHKKFRNYKVDVFISV